VKITQDEILERQTVLHIELEDSDIDPFLDKAYSRVVQRVNIPGFRKGKAPRRIIEQYFGKESLLNEIIDSMLPEMTGRAVSEQELDSVGLPSIDLESLEPFLFSATIPLRPDVDLGKYQDIRVDREEPTIVENAVDERVEQLRLSVASWEPIERPVELGDMISAEINGEVEGEEIINESEAVYLVNEDIGRPFPGFSEKLVGFDIDETNTFDLDIPEDFSDEKLAGKTASFKVKIKDVKERVLPDLDDEFAQGIGEGYETLEDLKVEIDKSIKEESIAESSRAYRESVIDALMNEATVEIPPLLIEHESSRMVEEQERMVTQANMVLDDYLQSIGKTRDELIDEAKTEAIERLSRTFVLSTLSDQEKIEVSENEIEDRIKELFSDSDAETPNASQTDEMKEYLERSMRMERTMERLESIAEGIAKEVVDEPDKIEINDTENEETTLSEGDDEDASQS